MTISVLLQCEQRTCRYVPTRGPQHSSRCRPCRGATRTPPPTIRSPLSSLVPRRENRPSSSSRAQPIPLHHLQPILSLPLSLFRLIRRRFHQQPPSRLVLPALLRRRLPPSRHRPARRPVGKSTSRIRLLPRRTSSILLPTLAAAVPPLLSATTRKPPPLALPLTQSLLRRPVRLGPGVLSSTMVMCLMRHCRPSISMEQ